VTINRRELLALGLAAPLAFSTAKPAAAQPDDLYGAAKAEGALTIYTGGATLSAEVKAFNARFPGLDVSVVSAYSNVNDVKIDRMLREHDVSADVVSFQTIQDFVRWNQAGELLPYQFPGFASFDPHYKDPGGAFVATSLYPLTYGYNPQLLAAPDVPRSALDFLRPAFKGKIVTCYPHDDDATLYLFSSLQQKYGWEFIDRYMANAPAFIEGHLGVAKAIAAGKSLVTFDCSAHMALDLRAQGQQIAIAFSPVDLQAGTGTWSARRDVPPPAGYKPLASYRLANDYRNFMVNATQVDALRRRFLAYTGPVVNHS
jgi:hypothetical protein